MSMKQREWVKINVCEIAKTCFFFPLALRALESMLSENLCMSWKLVNLDVDARRFSPGFGSICGLRLAKARNQNRSVFGFLSHIPSTILYQIVSVFLFNFEGRVALMGELNWQRMQTNLIKHTGLLLTVKWTTVISYLRDIYRYMVANYSKHLPLSS